ncbi:MAG: ABC transporter ATP-binding protein [Deltaproteobacteria bacterium]|nr:ABC transporter ATP-binding protein [Deltaproteobacteria bacterium]
MSDTLLHIKNLHVKFESRFGTVTALNGIDLEIRKGESLGIVGESGSGKSVTALSILKLLDENATFSAEEMLFAGEDLIHKNESDMRKIRGKKIAMIFQDPMSSLNPVLSVGWQVEENIRLHSDFSRKSRKHKVLDMFHLVNIPDPRFNSRLYPHQFSGGMNQRIMISLALSCGPLMLIADEPTTALDVTTQAQILDLIKKIMQEEQTALLMISHDLGVIREVCERVCVMYGGQILEEGMVNDVLYSPKHPYTRGLIRCIPSIRKQADTLHSISGEVPKGTDLPAGCVFHPRCEHVMARCEKNKPQLFHRGNRKVRCFLYEDEKATLSK